MQNKNPRVLLSCGDFRAVVQKANTDFMDKDLAQIVQTHYGESEDLYQVCLTDKRQPSYWFRANPIIDAEAKRLIKEIGEKYRKRQPLLIEFKFGTYKVEPVWKLKR